VAQVLAILDEIAPPSLAEDWDSIGLMIGRLDAEVSGIVVSLDASWEAVAAALESGADCLVSHHPALFKPLSVIDLAAPAGQVAAAAIRGGMNLLAAHTNLDSAIGGVNDVLAELLGIDEVKPLVPITERPGAGLGRVGRLGERLRLATLVGRVKESLRIDRVRVVGRAEMQVRRLAVCSGSGGSLIHAAAAAEAQALLTGEVGYHDAREAEALGLAVIEAGHYATEAPIVPVLAEKLNAALTASGFDAAVRSYTAEQEPFDIY